MEVYHANWKAQSIAGKGFANQSSFGAADDAAAATIAGILNAVTLGQLSSLTNRIYENLEDAYEEGSRRTATAIMLDADEHGAAWKFRLRNVITLFSDIDLKQLLMGELGTGVPTIVALADPPALPNTLAPVVVVNTAMVSKPGAI